MHLLIFIRYIYKPRTTGIFFDFPTAPDRDEILVDGTVFYAECNGIFFFREIKNKKVTGPQSYFFYLFVKESKLCFFLTFFLFYY